MPINFSGINFLYASAIESLHDRIEVSAQDAFYEALAGFHNSALVEGNSTFVYSLSAGSHSEDSSYDAITGTIPVSSCEQCCTRTTIGSDKWTFQQRV